MKWGISASTVMLMIVFLVVVAGMTWRILSARPVLALSLLQPQRQPDEEVIPNLAVENLTLAHSKDGMKERILRFSRARHRPGPEGGVCEVEEPKVLMARIRGMSFTLEAERGWFYPKSGNVRLAGNVHAASGTEREFFADNAQYFAEDDLLVARGKERPLRLVDHGSTIKARVLKTDGRFENIEIGSAEGELDIDLVQPEERGTRHEEETLP